METSPTPTPPNTPVEPVAVAAPSENTPRTATEKLNTALNWVAAGIYALCTLYMLALVITSLFDSEADAGLGMVLALGLAFPPLAITHLYTLAQSIRAIKPGYRAYKARFVALKWTWGALGALVLVCVAGFLVMVF